MRYYSGIGSRLTPKDVLESMTRIANELQDAGYILRSGGADGADCAFELGAGQAKEIFLPWKGFNGNNSALFNPSVEAMEMAAAIHPAWNRCSQGAKKLHARNIHQVLGKDLKTPSNLLICWTPNGLIVGGTATAIRLAQKHNIRVVNLCKEEFSIVEVS